MKRTKARIIAGALLVMSLAGCYPMDAVDQTNASQGTPAATQLKQVESPTSGGTTVTPAPPAGDKMATEAPPGRTGSPASPAPTAPAPAQTSPAGPTPTAPGYDPALQPLVEAAIQDLARRLAAATNEIEVVEAQAVAWPDASMGCPQPGMQYIQVPQDGAFIQLNAGGKLYNYHIGGNRGLFLCEQVIRSKKTPPKLDTFVLPPGRGEGY